MLDAIFKGAASQVTDALRMVVKIITLTTAGLVSGRMIREKIWKLLHPSIRAASSSSAGIWLMNCRKRNMLTPLVAKRNH